MQQNPSKIVVGGFDVLATGTVISFGWQPVELYPFDEIFRVQLLFETVAGQEKAAISVTHLPNLMQIRLINFDVVSGVGTGNPIYSTVRQGRKMYFSAYSFLAGPPATGLRLTAFTFHLGEAVSG
jgi:hypothetical protein